MPQNEAVKQYGIVKGDVGKIAPNLINRDFAAKQPNEKWAIDITEFSLFGKKLYLSTILDLYISEVISYTISHHPRLSLVMNMLNQAVEWLPQQHTLILHSDQGWHYHMKAYQRVLEANHIQQSMSRKGNCMGNPYRRISSVFSSPSFCTFSSSIPLSILFRSCMITCTGITIREPRLS